MLLLMTGFMTLITKLTTNNFTDFLYLFPYEWQAHQGVQAFCMKYLDCHFFFIVNDSPYHTDKTDSCRCVSNKMKLPSMNRAGMGKSIIV